MLREALCSDYEQSYACQELYEAPGGEQVDGSSRAPLNAPDDCEFVTVCASSVALLNLKLSTVNRQRVSR
eukprot:4900447-Pyramimonas_sp.AAC.1